MQITWQGHYTVKMTTKEAVVVLDPHSTETGLGGFRGKADIVALSSPAEPTMSAVSGITGDPLIIDTPGEYSVRDMSLRSFAWYDDKGEEHSIMRWTIEGMTILHLGALNRELNEEEMSAVNEVNIDVLLVPVGGGSGLSTKQAIDFVSTLEPRIVIPIHYKIPGTKEKLDDVEQFAKEFGISPKPSDKKVILKASKLPQDDMETIIVRA